MDGVDLMGRPKKYAPEEIVAKLRQVELMTAQGQAMADAIRAIGVSEQLRDELLKGEVFGTVREAQVLIEAWRVHDNTRRPHSALGYRPPAPEPAPEVVPWPASYAVRGARPATQPVAFGMRPN